MAQYFKRDEFMCKCGCGKNNVDEELVNRLDLARDVAGVASKINSGCRCKAHNEAVGGKTTSSHLKGLAVDIAAPSSPKRYKIHKALLDSGFLRIGVGSDFIHADIDRKKAQGVQWVY